MVAKPSQNDVFEFCGPLHLTSCLDWKIQEHRRSVLASLVKGVYVAEKDRREKRNGDTELAPAWWENFHFKCIKTLNDKKDSSICGAIFESMAPQNVPLKYVIAFRGTILEGKTGVRDCYLDAKVILNHLSCSSRCEIALDAVEGLIGQTNPKNIWLVGHSLGASIALQIGRDMVKRGHYLETYLFNPPYIGLPVQKLKNRVVKNGVRVTRSVIKASVSLALKSTQKNNTHDVGCDPFTLLHPWVPCLFVNSEDIICCEYIGYFEHREKMERWGVGAIERIATKSSVLSLASNVIGRDREALHLIPSAVVTKNMKNEVVQEHGSSAAHGLSQWWEQHSYWHSKCYQYKFSDGNARNLANAIVNN